MANEISATVNVQVSNGNFRSSFAPGTVQITQSAIGGHMPIVTVGTSEEVIGFGDITTLGLAALRNLDATNYVRVGPESGGAMVPMLRIKPGEVQFLRLEPGITVRAQANTAAVKLHVWALND